jgi:hypothetical protein
MTKNAPDFAGFAARASQAKKPNQPLSRDIDVVRHLQVRLTRNDAVRFKHAAEDRGLTIQSALVEAINRILAEWGEAPAADPAAGQK